ncbi:hypothetical protein DTO207G8_2107 [Paecilomyces variotii]|nr:hypothetical protein DTO207G8_2107 [Paecilomyces variotii]
MTRNNLKQHLTWLLHRGPSLYPTLQLPKQSENCSAATRTELKQSQPDSELFVPATVDPQVVQLDNPTELGVGDIDNDGDRLRTDTDMARLQFAPQSATKPRLLSSSSPRTPTVNGNGHSMHSALRVEDRYSLKDHADNSKRSSSQASVKKQLPRRSPLPYVKSPIADIDEIDLTGEFDEDASSSTIEAFGEARRIWREDFASRAEPTEKRGKKRKSDEYTSDLLSPKKTNPRILSPKSETKNELQDNFEEFQAPASPSPRKRTLSKKESQSPGKLGVKRKTPDLPRRAGSKRVIADSDDEEFDGVATDSEIVELHSDDGLHPSFSQRASTSNGSLGKAGPRPKKQKDESGVTDNNLLAATASRHQSTAKAHESATKISYVQTLPSPVTPSTQESRDDNVTKFLEISPQKLDGLIKTFEVSVEANAQIIYHRAMVGDSVDDLMSQNRILLAKANAVKQLRTEKAAHEKCASQKDELKKAMIEILKQGGDLSDQAAELAKSRSIAQELNAIEERISSLLQSVDVFSAHESDSFPARTSEQDVLVEATQPFSKHTQPDKGQSSFTERNLEPKTRSPVSTAPALQASNFQSAHGYDFQSRSKDAIRSSTETSSHARYTAGSAFEDRETQYADDDDFMIDEEIFTRNMGTPEPIGRGMDEFDLDANDEAMLQAAEDLEAGFSSDDDLPVQNRRVFAETSGNATKLSPAKKPTADPALMMSHPWSKDVKAVMRDRFHLRGFRPNQLEAINATLGGKDTFVLMPTGGGKSLCYQLPSVINSGRTKGVTIVISPLLSLMEDQVSHLKRLDIKAFFINGEVEADHRNWLMQTLASSSAEKLIQLLYITPEMINKNKRLVDCLLTLHRRQKLARIVIDEAHCVSQWGHDFRPDYKELGEVRSQFPGVPVMALTATATENVKVDVMHNLGMRGCEIFLQSFNRPNLTYEVRKKAGAKDVLASIAETITTYYKGQSGIIYCLSRNDCQKVAEQLKKEYRIKAEFYHAGMDSSSRANVQRLWQSGKCRVMVATIAFGMGIDKPDVRFVIHHSMPKSLEGYYQETGRAGRDGKRSGCYLYYGYRDVSTLRHMIDKGDGSREQKDRQHQMLRNVVQFCENRSDCRRVQVLAYFNEPFRKEDCNSSCDNCKSDAVFETHDFSEHAALAVKLVRRLKDNKERVTLLQCVDIFRGVKNKKIKDQHRDLPEFGAGSDLELGEVERLFFRLLSEEAFKEHNHAVRKGITIQYIEPGRRAKDFESGRQQLKLQVRVSPNGKAKRKKHGTGVRAATEDYPQSTNVSSPILSASRRRAARKGTDAMQGPQLSEDEDSDGFERIRIAGKPERRERHTVGPPITGDEKMKELDSIHHMVVEDFVIRAKKECHDIMMKKGLRSQPFSDSILRDMAIRFPKNESELLAIGGIDSDKVERYGSQFLRLIRGAQQHYEDLKGEHNGVVHDPNHDTVIPISSDDEFSDDDLFADGVSNLDLDNTITSQYFEVPQDRPSTSRSTRRVTSRGSPAPSTKGRQRAATKGTTKRTWRKKGADSGTKKRASGSRSSAAKGGNSSASFSKKGNSKSAGPRIEMMPV